MLKRVFAALALALSLLAVNGVSATNAVAQDEREVSIGDDEEVDGDLEGTCLIWCVSHNRHHYIRC